MKQYLFNIFLILCLFLCYSLIYTKTFIHRWAFQGYCDHIYDSTSDHLSSSNIHLKDFPELVKSKDIIFVRSECLVEFLKEVHPKINNPYVLVSHVGDNSIDENYIKYLNDPKIIAWFGINPEFNYHRKFFPIPIGIYQLKKVYDQKKELNDLFEKLNKINKNKLLYLNFTDDSHPERACLRNLLSNEAFCFQVPRRSFTEYLEEMAQFKFALSPRGIGLDCYRTWEALLVGCIPIVRNSYLNELYKDLPILIIDDWSEITEEFLNKKYIEITTKNYNFKKLYMDYWIKKINKVKLEYNI